LSLSPRISRLAPQTRSDLALASKLAVRSDPHPARAAFFPHAFHSRLLVAAQRNHGSEHQHPRLLLLPHPFLPASSRLFPHCLLESRCATRTRLVAFPPLLVRSQVARPVPPISPQLEQLPAHPDRSPHPRRRSIFRRAAVPSRTSGPLRPRLSRRSQHAPLRAATAPVALHKTRLPAS
jgi:hypothetical protein